MYQPQHEKLTGRLFISTFTISINSTPKVLATFVLGGSQSIKKRLKVQHSTTCMPPIVY